MKEQRKISAQLTVLFQGRAYDLSHIPGVMVGEIADIESTEQGVFVGFPAGTPVRHLVQARTLNEFGFSTMAFIFGQRLTVNDDKKPDSAGTDTQRQGHTFKLTQEDYEAIAGEIIKHFGGQVVALKPTQYLDALDHRDELLFTEFNGHNHDELSKKYNLSARGVYKALARYRKKQAAVVQHLVSAIAKNKAMHLDKARNLLEAAEPMLYQHTLEQLHHKLALLDLCNSFGGKRHD